MQRLPVAFAGGTCVNAHATMGGQTQSEGATIRNSAMLKDGACVDVAIFSDIYSFAFSRLCSVRFFVIVFTSSRGVPTQTGLSLLRPQLLCPVTQHPTQFFHDAIHFRDCSRTIDQFSAARVCQLVGRNKAQQAYRLARPRGHFEKAFEFEWGGDEMK